MTAQEIFRELITDHQSRTGFEMPLLLQEYLVELLASRLDRVDIIPEPSFAECYLRLYHKPDPAQIRQFGDQSLFFCSLMPDYGNRRGLDMSYYATLGISAYYCLGDLVRDARFTQLGNWFYHLQKFLNTAIHPDRRLDLFGV